MRTTSIALSLFPFFLFAGPSSPVVIQGEAQLHSPNSHTVEITTSERAILEWKDFSIGPDETTVFHQPSIQSVVLNRVVENPSQIFGRLEANGKLFLVNPNGIVFGESSQINASSFIASTLDVNDQAFLEHQEMLFTGESKEAIINHGTIRTSDGDLLLLGYQVKNYGITEAQDGMNSCLASNQILIKPKDEKYIFIRPAGSPSLEDNAYSHSFVHEGNEDALTFHEVDGEIFLDNRSFIQVSGKCSSKNSDGTGGDIYLLADAIDVLEGAEINVSNNLGGGNVWIGKDNQGRNAEITCIQENTLIRASALELGDGGQVISWGDQAGIFQGKIEAMGGPSGGDGGFVEVSGKQYLAFEGLVSTEAPQGQTGTLLLDPTDIFIEPALTGRPITPSTTIGTTTFFQENPGAPAQSEVTNGTVNLALAANNVEINTTSDFPFPPLGGTITLNAAIGTLAPNDLTLRADNDIIFNSGITSTGGGSVHIFARGDLLRPSITVGDNAFNGNINIGTIAEPIGGNLTILGGGSISTQSLGAFGGDINIFIRGDMSITTTPALGGQRFIISGSNIRADIGGNLTMADGPLAAQQTGWNSFQRNDVTVGGNVTMTSTGFFTNIGASNGFSLRMGGDFIVNGFGTSSTGAIALSPNDAFIEAGGNIILNGPVALISSSSFGADIVTAIAGKDLILVNGATIRNNGGTVDIVVDQQFPQPFAGPGRFIMNPGTTITGDIVRIFTSDRSFNTILEQINGSPFVPGPILVNTSTEQWGFYYPQSFGGIPFTIFYKQALTQIVEEAMIIVTEFLSEMNPLGEFFGWIDSFYIGEKTGNGLQTFLWKENYYLLIRDVNMINNPRTWTKILNDSSLDD